MIPAFLFSGRIKAENSLNSTIPSEFGRLENLKQIVLGRSKNVAISMSIISLLWSSYHSLSILCF